MKIVLSKFFCEQNNRSPVFTGPYVRLHALIERNWKRRKPGYGRSDRREVVTVPILCDESKSAFVCNFVNIETVRHMAAFKSRRREGEDSYVTVKAMGELLPIKDAYAVCYHRDTLLNSGEELTDETADWEVVAVVASPWKNAPVDPVTMARNYLEKPGGTFAPYTAQQFAESIYFWSQNFKAL